MDTIFALASAKGKSGVAVIRVSGPQALDAVRQFAAPVEPRRASLRTLRQGDIVLDEALVLAFPGPGSFTGEDLVEFHVHGSQATIAAVLSALGELDGFRLAEPGEFTRRALENEKLDLTQIEGLADLVDAETEAQRRQALRVLSGAIGEKTRGWRERLIRAAALIEATIDFADEDVPVDVMPEVTDLTKGVRDELAAELMGGTSAERVRDGFEVAIVGPPNVGKSSLLNALAGREAAITSEVAGTTRDVIEVRMDLDGLAVTLMDTAGLRETDDVVEAIGVSRALERARSADIRVILRPAEAEPVLTPVDDDIVLVSKADLGTGDLSVVTGQGIDVLIERLSERLSQRASGAGILIRQRHIAARTQAVSALDLSLDRIEGGPQGAELIAENLRIAVRALDSLVGRVDVEDLLDEIFSSFCIGK